MVHHRDDRRHAGVLETVLILALAVAVLAMVHRLARSSAPGLGAAVALLLACLALTGRAGRRRAP